VSVTAEQDSSKDDELSADTSKSSSSISAISTVRSVVYLTVRINSERWSVYCWLL